MRVDQLEKPEYRDILLYKIEENGHGDYPFFIQKVTVDHDEKKKPQLQSRSKYLQDKETVNYVCLSCQQNEEIPLSVVHDF